ncbi:amino acid adenylation domain-containing protein [Streptomyces sp. NPDC058045]|uniref:amino acid adenylation domain-containing protein n=1 Tax=Streptomyces sp. NPDC058045 TaxID=3346311 RepID=UPI0036DFBA21
MSLHELLLTAAGRAPGNIAISDPWGEVTYGELDRRANTLAHQLVAAGVRAGDRVVVWGEKSAAVVAAMQAVLRIGAAYVPADATTPPARVGVVVRDCAARAVVTSPDRSDLLRPATGPDVAHLDLDVVPDEAAPPVNAPVSPTDLAYILYTSGSTGTPKGVCISHQNARSFVDWAVAAVTPKPEDRFSAHASFTFDLSVFDLYAAFAAGASVHIVPSELAFAPQQLVEFLYEHEISVWYSVPSALTLMLGDGGLLDRPAPACLRAVLFAGEPFPIAQVRTLADWTSATLMNLYGPTETNVCTFHQVGAENLAQDRPLPIGIAASGDTVWAERPDGSPADVGEEGELMVEGPTVMLGYWGRAPQTGAYRTGDLVRVLPGGGFDYLGRRDHMVKVRGYRVELGEVESALGAHPDVSEAAVVVVGSGMDARLSAFVLPFRGREPGVLAIRGHCAGQLPRYMLPDEIRVVTELPRTGNGKIDRIRLHAISSGEIAG